MIEKYDLAAWRECLAIIVAKGLSDRRHNVTQLAKRLAKERMLEEALVCLAFVENY